MSSANAATRYYYLHTTLTFDRPELRDATYSYRPKAGTSHAQREFVGHDHAAAVRALESRLGGEYDSCSEYVSKAMLESTNADLGQVRTVRKAAYRVRDNGAERAERVPTEREQFERKTAAA